MASTLNNYGLTIEKQEEIFAGVVTRMQAIYGDSLVLDSNSPDRFIAEELTRIRLEVQETLLMILDSFDPEQASGVQLDQRCAINKIKRKQGVKATAQIQFVTSQEITLDGLDSETGAVPFKLSDAMGRVWLLRQTATIPWSPNGTIITYSFEADEVGWREADANTINKVESAIVGLTSATNPSQVTDNGSDIETDPQLRLRRRKLLEPNFNSVMQSMRLAVAQLGGVKEVSIIENNTDQTSVSGLPPHSYNLVADGGDKQEIIETMNKFRPMGILPFGNETGTVTEDDGNGTTYTFTISFDYALSQDLGVVMTIGGDPNLNIDDLQDYIALNFQPRINETVTINEVISIINSYNKNLYIVDDPEKPHGLRMTLVASVSPVLSPTEARNRFIFAPSLSDISIAP